ncbi:hypothetical protein ILYODFUR_014321 [Ilyodon furcidens]|uniref:Uncharacterized protein n=1 Tax=Ilyodon furcidens TaxID=33524 RepID=A0ABV0V2Z3_9TELE
MSRLKRGRAVHQTPSCGELDPLEGRKLDRLGRPKRLVSICWETYLALNSRRAFPRSLRREIWSPSGLYSLPLLSMQLPKAVTVEYAVPVCVAISDPGSRHRK